MCESFFFGARELGKSAYPYRYLHVPYCSNTEPRVKGKYGILPQVPTYLAYFLGVFGEPMRSCAVAALQFGGNAVVRFTSWLKRSTTSYCSNH